MRQRMLAGVVVLMVVAGFASPARADFNIATGLRWNPLRYTTPMAPVSGPGGANLNQPTQSWLNTSLDTYIGFFPIEQVGIVLSLDLGYLGDSSDFEVTTPTQQDPTPASGSYFQFGFGLGGKFYLNKPVAKRVSPYLFVDFFKYFASVSQNTPAGPANDPQLGFQSGLASPLGFDLAFGAEYFFTTSFSIGAEVIGLRYSYRSGDVQTTADGAIWKERFNELTMYTGISLNYRFLASASVKTYENEEDRRNPRVHRPEPRNPPPPPSRYDDDDSLNNPESVD